MTVRGSKWMLSWKSSSKLSNSRFIITLMPALIASPSATPVAADTRE